MRCNQYTRKDGTVGVGFEIEFSGVVMHSVAWPDRPADRMTPYEMQRLHCQCSTHLDDDKKSDDDEEISGHAIKIIDRLEESNQSLRENLDQAISDNLALTDEVGELKQKIQLDPSKEPNGETVDEPVAESLQETDSPKSDDAADAEESEKSAEPVSEAESIRQYLSEHPDADNKTVIDALAELKIKVSGSQVSRQRKNLKE